MEQKYKGLEFIKRSSHGYTLPYVLMILAVLGLFIPVLLYIISTRQQTDIQRIYKTQAISLAESEVESFITYLKGYNGSGKTISDYIKAYSGYTDDASQSIQLPGGSKVQYYLNYSINTNDKKGVYVKYSVDVRATSGTFTKYISYYFYGPTGISTSGGQTGTTSTTSPLLNGTSTPSGKHNDTSTSGIITSGSDSGDGYNHDSTFKNDFQNTIPVTFDVPLQVSTNSTTIDFKTLLAGNNGTLIDNQTNPVTINITVPVGSNGNSFTIPAYDFNQDFKGKTMVIYLTGVDSQGNTTPINVTFTDDFNMSGLLMVNGNVTIDGSGKTNQVTFGDSNLKLPGNLLVSQNLQIGNGTFTTVNGTVGANTITNEHGGSGKLNATGATQSYDYSNGFYWEPEPIRQQ